MDSGLAPFGAPRNDDGSNWPHHLLTNRTTIHGAARDRRTVVGRIRLPV